MDEIEHVFLCPFCGEQISVLLDLSNDGTHQYIEDCEVCCRPILLNYSCQENDLQSFDASRS